MTTPVHRRNGFALALVVFMLFAATVAGITGYQLVNNETTLADGNENYKEALAAYERFLALSNGQNADEEFKARQRSRIIKKELSKR